MKVLADPIQATKAATYACSGAACALAFVNQNAAAFGVALGILTFAANVFFQWRRDSRERRQQWDGTERRRESRD